MPRELTIELFEPGADDEAVDGLAGDLRLELLELDVDSVSPVALGPPPEGSKGMELVAIGALLVRVKDSLPMLTAVVTAVRRWWGRGSSSGRSLKITVDGRTLELSAATAQQQQQLVDEFLRSLGAPGADTGAASGGADEVAGSERGCGHLRGDEATAQARPARG